ncbi:hypothetical protein NDU88_004248 [Pleurodeles waltl]|uniref:Uncharacterized protein n=1 Tax=Pleurodeles waltl TaxID=8319 RepID=A0AAV7V454_PLEWA|nr:hypothetical protein NDU88_004248 [Pleurodeles waltl]
MVRVVEGSIAKWQVALLQKQVATITSKTATLEARTEDAQGGGDGICLGVRKRLYWTFIFVLCWFRCDVTINAGLYRVWGFGADLYD